MRFIVSFGFIHEEDVKMISIGKKMQNVHASTPAHSRMGMRLEWHLCAVMQFSFHAIRRNQNKFDFSVFSFDYNFSSPFILIHFGRGVIFFFPFKFVTDAIIEVVATTAAAANVLFDLAIYCRRRFGFFLLLLLRCRVQVHCWKWIAPLNYKKLIYRPFVGWASVSAFLF